MVFLVYSLIGEDRPAGSPGMPEHSCHFVLRGFLPVLNRLGRVIHVQEPEREVDALYDECRSQNETCFFLCFSPPNKAPVGLRCPSLCVLNWEFERIPDEVWNGDPKNDWRYVLARHGRAITLSQYSARAVKKAMGPDFPVVSIPVPVGEAFEDYRNRRQNETLPQKYDL